MINKLLWIDTETSGLLPEKHGIIQIAGIVEIQGKVKEKFMLLNNCSNKEISDDALKINGYTRQQISSFPKQNETYRKLIEIFGKYVDKYDKLDKFVVAGQQVDFDVNFLLQFFKDNGDNYFFSWVESRSYLDTKYILTFLQDRGLIPKLENSKNITISKYFGRDITGAHDAAIDIELTMANYKSMCALI
jgi:DNA polymerase III subunit epsilon